MKGFVVWICFLFVIATSTQSMAVTAEKGPFSVASLRFGSDGVYAKFDPAPVSCGGGEQFRMHAKVSSAAVNYKELTSALLTTYTTNQPLQWIWVDNEGVCSDTQILGLKMIEFVEK